MRCLFFKLSTFTFVCLLASGVVDFLFASSNFETATVCRAPLTATVVTFLTTVVVRSTGAVGSSTATRDGEAVGVGRDVSRGLAVGLACGVGVTVGVAVGEAVGDGVGVGVAVGEAVGDGVGVGVARLGTTTKLEFAERDLFQSASASTITSTRHVPSLSSESDPEVTAQISGDSEVKMKVRLEELVVTRDASAREEPTSLFRYSLRSNEIVGSPFARPTTEPDASVLTRLETETVMRA